jgi:cytoskeletal protein RodZ
MTAFIPKRLPQEETLGEKLRQARRYKNLKIEDIAKKINIRTKYLVALEEEHFDNLPNGLYGKNFLKEYALFLGLNPKELLDNLVEQSGANQDTDPFSQKIVKKHKFIVFPKIIKNILIASAVLICFLYLIFYFKRIVSPPKLIISQPEKNLLISDSYITVNGQTEPEAEVKINSEPVLNNHNGYFSQTVNLKKGLNNIVIKAKKKYSREQTVTRQILVK